MSLHTRLVSLVLASLACVGSPLTAPLSAQDLFDFESRQLRWIPLDEASELRGVVIDAETGEPLASAIVAIPTANVGTITGEDGWFQMVDPPDEWRTLEVSRVGFASRTIERPGPGSWAVRVLLVPVRLQLCGLEVSWPGAIPAGHIHVRARSVVTGSGIPATLVRATLHNLRDGAGSESYVEDEQVLEDGRTVEERVLVRIPGPGSHVLRVEATGFEPWWTAPITMTEANCQIPRSRGVDVWLVPRSGRGREPMSSNRPRRPWIGKRPRGAQ